MAKRRKATLERTILCATRFWGVDESVPTLRQGVRHVVRKQGFSSPEIVRAERKLIREGKLRAAGKGTGATLALTPKGGRVSCSTVRLSPWTDPQYPGSALRGRRKKRSK